MPAAPSSSSRESFSFSFGFLGHFDFVAELALSFVITGCFMRSAYAAARLLGRRYGTSMSSRRISYCRRYGFLSFDFGRIIDKAAVTIRQDDDIFDYFGSFRPVL